MPFMHRKQNALEDDFWPILNLAKSIYDTFRDQVHPVVGSILYCDIAMGYAEHSGIWVGENEIVHLNKYGDIELVNPYDFMSGTTALNVYASAEAPARSDHRKWRGGLET